jgi:hypothetical protein
MVNIRFSKALHYFTDDNLTQEILDTDVLREFLKDTIHHFHSLHRSIANELTRCESQVARDRLSLAKSVSKYSHLRVKNCLPHLQTTQELFWAAKEAESILRFIISTAIEQLPHFPEPFRTCFQDELMHTEDRLDDHCQRALNKMKALVTH